MDYAWMRMIEENQARIEAKIDAIAQELFKDEENNKNAHISEQELAQITGEQEINLDEVQTQ